jgi:signal peptidase I
MTSRKCKIFVNSIIIAFIPLVLLAELFVPYRIKGSSMENEFWSGDIIILHNSIYIVPKYLQMFGCNKFCRNDVMIFQTGNEICYLKRCAGISGDTIGFRNSRFFVNGSDYTDNSFIKVQNIQKDSLVLVFGKGNYHAVIPYSGYEIELNDSTYSLYKGILKRYEIDSIEKKMDIYHVNGMKCRNYKFHNNYYYFIGDNISYSLDSRALGFIPEYLIKGKCLWHFTSQ